MNRFLPRNIKDTPTHIFEQIGAANTERRLLEDAMDTIRSGRPLPQDIRDRLVWRPSALAGLLVSDTLSTEQASSIITTPTLAFNVVCEAPSLFPIWKDMIMANPETVEQLYFLWRYAGPKIGRFDPEEVIAALAEHPSRLLRVLHDHDKDRYNEANKRLAIECDAKKYTSPAWAYEWLRRNAVEDDMPLEPALAAVLSKDEGLTCQAIAYVLRPAVLSSEVWRMLEPGIKSPRWLYQGLLWGVFVEDELRAQKALHAHPAWLVEWLVDSQASYNQVTTAYLAASAASSSHVLSSDLHNFGRSLVVLDAARRGAVS